MESFSIINIIKQFKGLIKFIENLMTQFSNIIPLSPPPPSPKMFRVNLKSLDPAFDYDKF